MQTEADMRLDRKYMDGKLNVNVEELDLYKLGVAPKPLEHPFAFSLGAEARHDSIKLQMDAGDMNLQFRARSTLKELLEQSDEFVAILTKQIEDSRLDHAALRRVLPSAGMQLTAGQANPVSYFLKTKDITFNDFILRFGSTPTRGINGRTAVHGFVATRYNLLYSEAGYFPDDVAKRCDQRTEESAVCIPQYVDGRDPE